MATLTISIDRTSLPGSLAPLVFSATENDGNALGIESFTEPGKQARIAYMPDSQDVHGSEPVAWAWQQGLLSWETFADADTEAESRSLLADVVAAVSQFSYTVTVTRNGVADTWSANPGSVVPAGDLTLEELESHNPTYVVTIPVYPIAS